MVHITAEGCGLPTVALPFPIFLHKLLAVMMSFVLRDPPVTRSQVQMLADGMYGDSTTLHQALQQPICPTPFSAEYVRTIESKVRVIVNFRRNIYELISLQIPSIFPFSLRIINDSTHYKWMLSFLPQYSFITGLLLFQIFPVGFFLKLN